MRVTSIVGTGGATSQDDQLQDTRPSPQEPEGTGQNREEVTNRRPDQNQARAQNPTNPPDPLNDPAEIIMGPPPIPRSAVHGLASEEIRHSTPLLGQQANNVGVNVSSLPPAEILARCWRDLNQAMQNPELVVPMKITSLLNTFDRIIPNPELFNQFGEICWLIQRSMERVNWWSGSPQKVRLDGLENLWTDLDIYSTGDPPAGVVTEGAEEPPPPYNSVPLPESRNTATVTIPRTQRVPTFEDFFPPAGTQNVASSTAPNAQGRIGAEELQPSASHFGSGSVGNPGLGQEREVFENAGNNKEVVRNVNMSQTSSSRSGNNSENHQPRSEHIQREVRFAHPPDGIYRSPPPRRSEQPDLQGEQPLGGANFGFGQSSRRIPAENQFDQENQRLNCPGCLDADEVRRERYQARGLDTAGMSARCESQRFGGSRTADDRQAQTTQSREWGGYNSDFQRQQSVSSQTTGNPYSGNNYGFLRENTGRQGYVPSLSDDYCNQSGPDYQSQLGNNLEGNHCRAPCYDDLPFTPAWEPNVGQTNRGRQEQEDASFLEFMAFEWPPGWDISQTAVTSQTYKDVRETLPKFDGEATKYRSWREFFKGQVHNNSQLNVLQKSNLITGTEVPHLCFSNIEARCLRIHAERLRRFLWWQS